jgi:hypothetical protein
MRTSHELLPGAFDLHVHASPDIRPRSIDAVELIDQARRVGMAGVLIKDHVTITSDRAYILNKIFPDFKVFGSIALNYTVGGLNPSAVRAAVGLGVKQVYMPTYSAAYVIKKHGVMNKSFADLFPPDGKSGISILSKKGGLLPEIDVILRTIKEHDVILGTGHLAPEESLKLVERANQLGVQKILVTHPSSLLTDMSLDDQKKAVEMGAFIEHCYVGCTPFTSTGQPLPTKEMADQIKGVGAEHCVMSTDFGQLKNLPPVEGMREFIEEMLRNEITEDEIDWMIRKNPRKLLNLDQE